MKFNKNITPRTYNVGVKPLQIMISDCGSIELGENEQVTFITESGSEHDVTRKEWGFYATSSLNHRLKFFQLKACLVINNAGRIFLMLVEASKQQSFFQYLESDQQKLICWLDQKDSVDKICNLFNFSSLYYCYICEKEAMEILYEYTSPNGIEKNFKVTESENYQRMMYRCKSCGHCREKFNFNQELLYKHEYVDSTYKNTEGIEREFSRINSLNPETSDNIGRVRRINEYIRLSKEGSEQAILGLKLLDVGAGLGVFPYQMKKLGWDCTAIDMDERLSKHHREVIGIQSYVVDLRKFQHEDRYDLITFNKVLEHVEDPLSILVSAKKFLKEDGFIYIELPDAEGAATEGEEREEFYIGHIHVFSFASFSLLAQKAGMYLVMCRRIKEPSGKFTLWGILKLHL